MMPVQPQDCIEDVTCLEGRIAQLEEEIDKSQRSRRRISGIILLSFLALLLLAQVTVKNENFEVHENPDAGAAGSDSYELRIIGRVVGPADRAMILQNVAESASDDYRLAITNNGGTEILTIDDDSMVGINTFKPNEELTVEGVISLDEITAPGNTAGYGKIYVKSTTSNLYFQDDGGTEYDLTETNLGKDYQSASSSGQSTTTSSTFQTKVSLTTPALTGTYRVSWCALVDNGGALGEARLRNTTDGNNVNGVVIYKASDSNELRFVGGFGEVSFSGAAKTFTIEFRDQSGGNTQGIQEAKIEFWRVN